VQRVSEVLSETRCFFQYRYVIPLEAEETALSDLVVPSTP